MFLLQRGIGIRGISVTNTFACYATYVTALFKLLLGILCCGIKLLVRIHNRSHMTKVVVRFESQPGTNPYWAVTNWRFMIFIILFYCMIHSFAYLMFVLLTRLELGFWFVWFVYVLLYIWVSSLYIAVNLDFDILPLIFIIITILAG